MQVEAIKWSWELLTEVYKLPKDRLYATYFEGCKELNLGPDLEAKQIWLDIGWVGLCLCVHVHEEGAEFNSGGSYKGCCLLEGLNK